MSILPDNVGRTLATPLSESTAKFELEIVFLSWRIQCTGQPNYYPANLLRYIALFPTLTTVNAFSRMTDRKVTCSRRAILGS